MSNLSEKIDAELKERYKQTTIFYVLSRKQYELLRLRGMSAKKAVQFEELLRTELKARENDQMFIASSWVEERLSGKEPDQIGYDMCHAVR